MSFSAASQPPPQRVPTSPSQGQAEVAPPPVPRMKRYASDERASDLLEGILDVVGEEAEREEAERQARIAEREAVLARLEEQERAEQLAALESRRRKEAARRAEADARRRRRIDMLYGQDEPDTIPPTGSAPLRWDTPLGGIEVPQELRRPVEAATAAARSLRDTIPPSVRRAAQGPWERLSTLQKALVGGGVALAALLLIGGMAVGIGSAVVGESQAQPAMFAKITLEPAVAAPVSGQFVESNRAANRRARRAVRNRRPVRTDNPAAAPTKRKFDFDAPKAVGGIVF